MDDIRQPAVAGTFYPAEPSRLRKLVLEYLETAVPAITPQRPKAIIAPHAGYIYSGPVAGSAFKSLKGKMAGVRRAVIIGPAHTKAIRGLAAVSASAFGTPLGAVTVDKAGVDAVLALPQVQIDDAAHVYEHSLEVMLPFLQIIAQDFSIIPLVAGQTTGEEVAELLSLLWDGPDTIIVISSDLSHYYGYGTAKKLDGKTAEAIQQCRPENLKRESACGVRPIQGLLIKAREKGLRTETADLRNSGDTAGSKDRVVGYGAFLFYEGLFEQPGFSNLEKPG